MKLIALTMIGVSCGTMAVVPVFLGSSLCWLFLSLPMSYIVAFLIYYFGFEYRCLRRRRDDR